MELSLGIQRSFLNWGDELKSRGMMIKHSLAILGRSLPNLNKMLFFITNCFIAASGFFGFALVLWMIY